MKKPSSTFSVTIDNLPQIAAAYSEGVAARVLYETWQRLSSTLGADTWHVSEKSWGVALEFRGNERLAAPSVIEFIEAAVTVAARRPVAIGPHRIVMGLSADFGHPIQADGSARVEASQYRLDMCAAALAYGAIDAGMIHFAEQPVVAAGEKAEPLYFECLARLVSDDGAVIVPGTYLGALERLGLVRAFDRHVVREVIRQLRLRPDVVLGCNISGQSAVRDFWWKSTFEELSKRPDIAGRLVIEITETAALPDVNEAVAFVSAVRQTGARVALDDFGAGHSSPTFARNARVDIVKIDGSYVRQRIAGPDGRYLLHHLVNLVGNLGSTVVIEGIESAEDLRLAVETGAKWFQGFYFQRPQLPHHVLDWIVISNPGRPH
ncbi:EAL domain-containing protein [Rhizobium sp. C4]|uniref:EAL domain-containing protein n=1 Tax=Rhizobium sp. C4 TaxID=1349800 RepID=UPI001E30344B|nr:EAL domain-containing protein [Rhizobium sp. C4]MCD2172304.1 EAL domain-containing protein [Rhizobium sp. C4]